VQWDGQMFFYFVLLRSLGLQTNLGFAHFITGSTNIQPGMKYCTCFASCATLCSKVSKRLQVSRYLSLREIFFLHFSTYEQDNSLRVLGCVYLVF
jgi:hypothetical protein